MKLRLYTLRDIRSDRAVPDLFFSDKTSAKKERDALNAHSSTAQYVVSPGPDHYRYQQRR